MKTKTESKRQAILQAAAEVFREVGFRSRVHVGYSLSRIGGSKATLYNYFPRRRSWFFEVMHQGQGVELEGNNWRT